MGVIYASVYLYHEQKQAIWCACLESVDSGEDILTAYWGRAFTVYKHARTHLRGGFVSAWEQLEAKRHELEQDGYIVLMENEYPPEIAAQYGFPNLGQASSGKEQCSVCGASLGFLVTRCPQCGADVLAPGKRSPGRPVVVPASPKLLAGRYELLEVVGQGGYGKVYRARDSRLAGRIVAIKEVRTDTFATKEEQRIAVSGFEQEMQLLVTLNHPNLPTIFDYWSESGASYLAMSFIDGENLQEVLEHGTLPDFYPLAYTLCDVLAYLHRQSPPIIFRDLKPSNVMLDSSGRLYLIDFGIARFFKAGQKKDTTAIGSPGFAAPEQYGKAQTSPRSDIYSLGATLYFLATGDDPADHPFEFKASFASPALKKLVLHMLTMDADKRPATIEEVRQALVLCEHKKTPTKPVAAKETKPALKVALISQMLLDPNHAAPDEKDLLLDLEGALLREIFPTLGRRIDLEVCARVGDDRAEHLQQACLKSDALLVVVTKKFYTSRWGKWSFEMVQYAAETSGKPVLALLIEDPGISWKRDPFWGTDQRHPFVTSIEDAQQRAYAYTGMLTATGKFLSKL
jgi:serine/threonine protein kinase